MQAAHYAGSELFCYVRPRLTRRGTWTYNDKRNWNLCAVLLCFSVHIKHFNCY